MPKHTVLRPSKAPPNESTARSHSPFQQQNLVESKTPRPDPQSQSFSRSYGSILPTSLIYIYLTARGYKPWRPDAVMSTARGENKSLHRVFTGHRTHTEAIKKQSPFPELPTPSPRKAIPGPVCLLTRKENSPRGVRQRPRLRLCYHSISTSWLGNINPIPFR